MLQQDDRIVSTIVESSLSISFVMISRTKLLTSGVSSGFRIRIDKLM